MSGGRSAATASFIDTAYSSIVPRSGIPAVDNLVRTVSGVDDIEKSIANCNWGGLAVALGTSLVPEGKALKLGGAALKVAKVEKVATSIGKTATKGAATPTEAREVLAKIDTTGSPYRSRPYANDGRSNTEILPGRPIYTEHDIYPIPTNGGRGPERIVTGNDGAAYYTQNHYDTFIKMR